MGNPRTFRAATCCRPGADACKDKTREHHCVSIMHTGLRFYVTVASCSAERVCTAPIIDHGQVMLRVFFFFATFGEALSQTAQAFIPGQLAREKSLRAAKTASAAKGDIPAFVGVGTDGPGVKARDSPARTMMR